MWSFCNWLSFFFFFWLCWVFIAFFFLVRLFSSCGKWGLLLVAVFGLLIAGASRRHRRRLTACGLQELQHRGSGAVARGLSWASQCMRSSWETRLNPCPLHGQADSHPLRYQGNPASFLFSMFSRFTHMATCIGAAFFSLERKRNCMSLYGYAVCLSIIASLVSNPQIKQMSQ